MTAPAYQLGGAMTGTMHAGRQEWPFFGPQSNASIVGSSRRRKMPEPQADWPRTLEAFRVWHERQPEIWEFIYGVPKLMAPGSKAHTVIKGNAYAGLTQALHGTGCHALVDGAIVEVHGSSLIPDIVVTCAPLDFSTPRVDEPLIIALILSPSNQSDDMGRKLSLYLEIPSLRHYLVIHQDRRQIVHHQRRDALGGVFLTNIAPPDPLRLDPPGIEIALAAIYEGVPLD
jgi:Uma2 family endonuclease